MGRSPKSYRLMNRSCRSHQCILPVVVRKREGAGSPVRYLLVGVHDGRQQPNSGRAKKSEKTVLTGRCRGSNKVERNAVGRIKPWQADHLLFSTIFDGWLARRLTASERMPN